MHLTRRRILTGLGGATVLNTPVVPHEFTWDSEELGDLQTEIGGRIERALGE